jgi:hypothetical protein
MKNIIFIAVVTALVLATGCDKGNTDVVDNQTSNMELRASGPLGPYRTFDGKECIDKEGDCFPVDIDVIGFIPYKTAVEIFSDNRTTLIRYIDKKIVDNVINGTYSASILLFNKGTNTYYVEVKDVKTIYPMKLKQ